MQDHLTDIKKYTSNPVNETAVAHLVKTYQLVMSKPDSRYVACSDPVELARVKDNFLIKKLKLEGVDFDGALKATCQKMKADHTKSRLTFYYLLAEHFGKLEAL